MAGVDGLKGPGPCRIVGIENVSVVCICGNSENHIYSTHFRNHLVRCLKRIFMGISDSSDLVEISGKGIKKRGSISLSKIYSVKEMKTS